MTRAFGYIRSSTDDQKLTIEAQERDIADGALRLGLDLARIYADPGTKGATSIERCEGLSALMSVVQPGDTVLVVKRDRLSRKLLKQLLIEEELEQAEVTVHSLDGTGNGNTDQDWAQRILQGFFAEYEARQTRARTRRAAAQKKAKGERWGQVPYGYTVGADKKKLHPCECQQDVIRTMRSMRDGGFSFRDIAGYLTDEGIPTKSGNRNWTHQAVRSILKRDTAM